MTTITTFMAQGTWLVRWSHGLLLKMTGERLRELARGRAQAAAARGADNDAAAVRALADSYRKSDPGFASDLYAAANRHERDRDAANSA